MELLEVSKFVPQSGLSTYKNTEVGKIERMMNLPRAVRERALEEFLHTKDINKLRSVLDVLDPIIGESIQRPIVVDRSFLEEFGTSFTKNRRSAISSMNMTLNHI
jgi:hypothetical protein